MRTILFPTDFSETAENAETHAIEIARIKDAKLFLLHVEEEREIFESSPTDEFESEEVLVEENFYVRLKKIIKRHQMEDFPHACLVKEGEVTTTVIKMIEDLDADMVVMGTNGNEDFERSNSNATEIIRKAKCSVLTIPKDARYKPISKIVYATDLVHKDGQAFKNLARFAAAFGADITLLHVNIDGKDVPGKAPLKSIPEIKEALDYDKVDSKVIIAASLMEGIEKYTSENPVDVLAMTSHSNAFLDRFFRDSKIEKMVLSAQIPVLTFHK